MDLSWERSSLYFTAVLNSVVFWRNEVFVSVFLDCEETFGIQFEICGSDHHICKAE
jgi:hypothetical protein